MKKTYTQRAFTCLLIPLFHIVSFAVFLLLATVTEDPPQRSGILYLLFGTIDILLMVTFPLVQLVCGIKSIVHQVKALHNKESKAKNYVMMAVSVLYFVAAVIYSYQLWVGMMSV